MREYLKFYIDGQWVDPAEPKTLDVDNPTTEEVSGKIALGTAADVDRAVKAARKAFGAWSQSTREERLDVLQAIMGEYQKRAGDLAAAVNEEMGAPASLAAGPQVGLGLGHLSTAIDALKNFEFEEQHGSTLVVKEPIGVCALITPWNWPINQIACKVFPALATGCTMVLKPSEVAPYSAQIFAEIIDAAGVPAGVFNLVYGDGPGVGTALSTHPDVDMVSFTGSTRAGIEVARNAAPTVKRVTLELGGKSPNIVLDDENFAASVAAGVQVMMVNSGQSCNAPSRMLVPNSRMAEAAEVARTVIGGAPHFAGATVAEHRTRRDLRAGAVHSRIRRSRSGGRHRQRHRIRSGGLCFGRRPRCRPRDRPPDPRRFGGHQPRIRHQRAVRWVQKERQRP